MRVDSCSGATEATSTFYSFLYGNFPLGTKKKKKKTTSNANPCGTAMKCCQCIAQALLLGLV